MKTFLDLLAKQDFAAATAMYTGPMQHALPERKLRELWAAIGAQAGAFKSRGAGRAEALLGDRR